jgi:hypothetical protein
VIQNQPRREATVTFIISRSGASLTGSIVYRIDQKFRSAEELNDIFVDAHRFAENVRPPTLAGIRIQLKANWTPFSKGYALKFVIDRRLVNAMLARNHFEFDPGFPRVYWDVSPQVTFSSQRLRQSLLAVSR